MYKKMSEVAFAKHTRDAVVRNNNTEKWLLAEEQKMLDEENRQETLGETMSEEEKQAWEVKKVIFAENREKNEARWAGLKQSMALMEDQLMQIVTAVPVHLGKWRGVEFYMVDV